MTPPSAYRLLADGVLVLHAGVVLFVVGGLVAILAGHLPRRPWRWVDGPVFRGLHAAAIAVVVVQAWLGQHCPLTTLESWLRLRAGAAGYAEAGFVAHWLQRLIFYEAPFWVFTLAYTAFGALVAWTWWRFPPRRRRARGHGAG